MCIRDSARSSAACVTGGAADGRGAGAGFVAAAWAATDPETDTTRSSESTERIMGVSVSYTHLRAHETVLDLVCRLLLEKKQKTTKKKQKKEQKKKKKQTDKQIKGTTRDAHQ